jgi:hypothetical protein
MADNIDVTPGSGATIATDQTDGGTRHVQIVKLAVSTADSSAGIPSDATNGLYVNVTKATQSAPQHANGYSITGKTAQYTTTQTGVALWTPASGKKIVITSYQIQAYGTTAATVQVWFGGSADTTYTRGTDLAIFDGEFAPSSTNKPGVAISGTWMSATADDILRVTTSAGISLTVTVWGYEV